MQPANAASPVVAPPKSREDSQMMSGAAVGDRARLSAEVQLLRSENAELKLQTHELSLLLDAALAKLEALGHSLVPTYASADMIRRLRAARDEERQQGGWERSPLTGAELAVNPHSGVTKGAADSRAGTVPASTTNGSTATSAAGGARYRQAASFSPHRGAVLAGEFCPNKAHAHLLATASFDCTAAVVNTSSSTSSSAHEAKVLDHGAAVTDIAWFSSGAHAITCSLDGTAAVRDVEAGLKSTYTYRSSDAAAGNIAAGGLQRLSPLPDRSHLFLVLAGDGSVSLIDDRTGRGCVASLVDSEPFTAMCADGGINGFGVATGDARGIVGLWDLRLSSNASAVASTPPAVTPTTPAPSANLRRYEMSRSGTVKVGRSSAPVTHLAWGHDTGDRGVIVTVSDDGGARVFREDKTAHKQKPRGNGGGGRQGGGQHRKTSPNASPAVAPGGQQALNDSVQLSPTARGPPAFAPPQQQSIAERHFGFDVKASIQARSYPIRAAFRPGTRDVNPSSMHARLHDDDESDAPRALRRVLGDDDLLACGGTDCVVRVFQREGSTRSESRATARRATQIRSGNTDRAGVGRDVAAQGSVALDDDEDPSDDSTDSDAGLADDDVVTTAAEDGVRRLVQLQVLEGHRDVVYGATFHHTEPVLASYSADATVRVWRSARAK